MNRPMNGNSWKTEVLCVHCEKPIAQWDNGVWVHIRMGQKECSTKEPNVVACVGSDRIKVLLDNGIMSEQDIRVLMHWPTVEGTIVEMGETEDGLYTVTRLSPTPPYDCVIVPEELLEGD